MAKLILKKSSVVTDGEPKAPVVVDLEYGELAINYATGTLFYKKSDNTIGILNPTATSAVLPALWARSFALMGA